MKRYLKLLPFLYCVCPPTPSSIFVYTVQLSNFIFNIIFYNGLLHLVKENNTFYFYLDGVCVYVLRLIFSVKLTTSRITMKTASVRMLSSGYTKEEKSYPESEQYAIYGGFIGWVKKGKQTGQLCLFLHSNCDSNWPVASALSFHKIN